MMDERGAPAPESEDWTDARPGRPPVLAVDVIAGGAAAAVASPQLPVSVDTFGSVVGHGQVEGGEDQFNHLENSYGQDGDEQVGDGSAAQPQSGYDQPDPASAGALAPGPEQLHWGRTEPVPVSLPRVAATPAQWGWRSYLRRGSAGLLRFAPGEAEQAYRKASETIRRSTWKRSVNVVVTNPKGGSGKTPATLILAGILGSLRGGYVVACEASESCGTLARRAEGDPALGLAELLADIAGVDSAGRLGSYTAPQTSHSDVIGSLGPRGTLSASQLLSVREILDTYYRISVFDTGNNPGHETYRCALRMADAVLIPCLMSPDSIAGMEATLDLLASGSVPEGLRSRAVVVIGHDGGPEDPQVAAALRRRLAVAGLTDVVEVPFEPVIRRGGEIALCDLGEESRRAWTLAAAAVVRALSLANTEVALVAQMRGEIG